MIRLIVVLVLCVSFLAFGSRVSAEVPGATHRIAPGIGGGPPPNFSVTFDPVVPAPESSQRNVSEQ